MKKMILAVALAFVSMAGTAQGIKANLDESVKPGDDFWQYAVGGWLKANPLDKQHAENGAFTDLRAATDRRLAPSTVSTWTASAAIRWATSLSCPT